MKILISVFIFLCTSQNALACRVINWNASQWARHSESVYFVRVVGVSVPEILERDHKPTAEREKLLTSRLSKLVEVHVYETLKGEEKDRIIANIHWCSGGSFELANIAILFQLGGKWHIRSAVDEIDLIIANLKKPVE